MLVLTELLTLYTPHQGSKMIIILNMNSSEVMTYWRVHSWCLPDVTDNHHKKLVQIIELAKIQTAYCPSANNPIPH